MTKACMLLRELNIDGKKGKKKKFVLKSCSYTYYKYHSSDGEESVVCVCGGWMK